MKLNKKVLAVALASVIVAPSVSHASSADAQRLINKLNQGMRDIGNLSGQPVDIPVYQPTNTSTSTTTTTTTSTSVTSNNKSTKDLEKEKAATAAELRAAFERNTAKAEYAEKMLNNYPKTVKGIEEDLVKIINDSHKLRVQAAATLNTLTGEKLVVASPNVPAAYLHLIRY